MVHVRVGDGVELQQLVDHGVYEIIAPFRPKSFRAVLYECDLFVGQGPWSQLSHRRGNRPSLGKVPRELAGISADMVHLPADEADRPWQWCGGDQ
jgi:hypothetical protein